ncbi:MAG: glycosyltransferase family 4 protein [Desulfobulbaceae bacterium]|nr:glycosyltransferase family 4 protein [Desulfobulbaceae bacterium]
MKILLANKFFHLNGGSETVFFQEREFLLKQGHKVVDFSMADERNLDSPFASSFVPNINYQNSKGIKDKLGQGASLIHSPIAVKNISQLAQQEKPEIAHLHNIYHQLTPSIIPALKKQGIKVVLTLHDYKLVCPGYLALKNEAICNDCAGRNFWKPFTTNCQNSRLQGLLLAAEAMFHQWRGSYDGVDLFIAPSRFLADLVGKRIAPKKIRVLRNGIDVDRFQPNYQDQGYGLYFGRLSKEKGVTTLLAAHRQLATEIPLKIVGTGPLADELQTRYPKAEFLGYKTGRELNELIANAAFVVVPSEWYENCSMVVLEAMALGKPIIGSRIGGIPEQIEDGQTGFLFEMGNEAELADKMKILASDQDLRKNMGKAARAKLEKDYSLKNHCDELLKIYNELTD